MRIPSHDLGSPVVNSAAIYFLADKRIKPLNTRQGDRPEGDESSYIMLGTERDI